MAGQMAVRDDVRNDVDRLFDDDVPPEVVDRAKAAFRQRAERYEARLAQPNGH